MFNLLDKYRFTANDGGGDTPVTPVNEGLKIRFERQDDGVWYRKTLNTELLFRDGDYQFFKTALDADVCEITLLVEQFCEGEWGEFFTGRIVPSEGKYNLDACEAELRVYPNDVRECAKRKFPKQYNFLSFGERKVMKSLWGAIESTTCVYNAAEFGDNTQFLFLKDCWSGGTQDTQSDTEPDPALAWRPTEHFQIFDGGGLLDIQTVWKREKVTQVGMPPGFGWVNIGGNDWVRPVTYTFESTTDSVNSKIFVAGIADFDVSGGRLLRDVIPDVIDETGCGIDEVVSDFFGINPDATAPSNDAYTFASEFMQDVLLFQKSDIADAAASSDASRLPLSITDFLNSLRDCLNVYWTITESGGTVTMRIEHYTYFEGNVGYDLTALDGGIYIDGMNRFETESEIPAFERFAYQESFNDPFLPKSISYDCSTGDEIEKQLTQLSADFSGIYSETSAGLVGFMLIVTYPISGSNYLLDNTDGYANGAMSWQRLFDSLWPFGRYSYNATSDAGGSFAVQSLKRRKTQPSVTIPFCCPDGFVESDIVITGLGNGQVKNAEIDTQRGDLTLTLTYE